jgi:trimethylamine--corrinoid protein Co-methyltransferase
MFSDMISGSPAFGSIANSLHQAIFNQMWRRYEVPTYSSVTAFSSSKLIDYQCGYEKSMSAILAAISGVNVVILHGGLYGELSYHPVLSILDDDVAGMIGRFIEGVQVSDETLAVNLIEKTGPIPGYYLNTAHTRKFWKTQDYMPKGADRFTYPEWIQKGKKSTLDYGKDMMQEILSKHEPTPLSEDQDKAIDEILKEAKSYYTQKGLL